MNTITSATSVKHAEAEFFSSLINYSIEHQLSIALWQLPNDNVRHVILSQQHKHLEKNSILEDEPTGFIFAPFDREKKAIMLHADFIFSFTDQGLKEPETPLEIDSLVWFNENVISQMSSGSHNLPSPAFNLAVQDKGKFLNLVNRSLKQIEKGIFEKVVPSRYQEISLTENFDIVGAFKKLYQRYPNALISFVSIPGVGNWLGASPELLVSVEGKTIFKTIALAGTKPYNDSINLKNVAWTQKEIEEQALVERYIISCLKKIRIREYDEYGPRTVVAGNLMHLKSEFTVDMKATNFPQLGSVMLELLHPTSAVCGVPLDKAREFLLAEEGYDREFYAGYLGPVNVNNNINIFVNLRCMQLFGNKAICYAGAGVTIDSVAEEEWLETELKMKTILTIVN